MSLLEKIDMPTEQALWETMKMYPKVTDTLSLGGNFTLVGDPKLKLTSLIFRDISNSTKPATITIAEKNKPLAQKMAGDVYEAGMSGQVRVVAENIFRANLPESPDIVIGKHLAPFVNLPKLIEVLHPLADDRREFQLFVSSHPLLAFITDFRMLIDGPGFDSNRLTVDRRSYGQGKSSGILWVCDYYGSLDPFHEVKSLV